MRWKYETGLGISSSPAANEDVAVVGSKDGFLSDSKTKTGQLALEDSDQRRGDRAPGYRQRPGLYQAGGTQAFDIATGKWRGELGWEDPRSQHRS